MSSASSTRVVIIAVIANFAIAVTKFLVAWFSRSSAMLSEAIHSVVDTGNQLLLLLGIYRSRQSPDETHPFGYGKELYFWSLIVAILLFGIGGGMAIYEGVTHLLNPKPLRDPTWAYVVLGVAGLFEGYAWFAALKAIRAGKERRGVWQLIRGSKDPAVVTVLLEDSAALTGLLVAFLGIFLGHRLNNPYLDGAAAVIIGLMLCFVALVLVRESKGLLLGESADPDAVAGIRKLIADDPAVRRVIHVLTMHFGPQDVLVNLEIQFQDKISAQELVAGVDRLEAAIKLQYPHMKRIFIEAAPFRRY